MTYACGRAAWLSLAALLLQLLAVATLETNNLSGHRGLDSSSDSILSSHLELRRHLDS